MTGALIEIFLAVLAVVLPVEMVSFGQFLVQLDEQEYKGNYRNYKCPVKGHDGKTRAGSEEGLREVILGSAHFHYDEPEPPTEAVEELARNCRGKGSQMVIGHDANAHHSLGNDQQQRDRFKHIIICVLLLVYTTVNGTVNVCIRFNEESTGPLEEYSMLVKVLKQELTELLVGDTDTFYPHLDFDFQHPAISAKGELNNVTVSNLDDSDLKFFKNVDLSKNNIELFNLTFHNIYVSGEYNLTGNIGDLFDIFGEGPFWINPVNFSISASSNVPDINSTHICLTLGLDVTLASMKSWFTNLMNEEELEDLLNKAIASLFPEIIDVLSSEFKDAVDGPLQQWIDSVLTDHSQYILMKILRSKEKFKTNTGAVEQLV